MKSEKKGYNIPEGGSLGLLALGDIGHHFPDTDSQYESADSMLLLQHVYALIKQKGYRLNNADITILDYPIP